MEFGDQHNDILMDMKDYYCPTAQQLETKNSSYFFHSDPIASVQTDHFHVQTCESMNQFDEPCMTMYAPPIDPNYQFQNQPLEITTEEDIHQMQFGDIYLEGFPADYSAPMMIAPTEAAQIRQQDTVLDHSAIACHTNEYGRLGVGKRRAYGLGRKRLDHVNYDEIRKYFRMPIMQAAKEMNVGLTVLKKRCRELGIARWPHRKMKSLESLIHNFQEMENGTSDATIQRELKMLEEHRALMEENPEVQLTERTKKLRQAFFKESYKRRRAAGMHSEHGYFGR